jgi:hypothetical protein
MAGSAADTSHAENSAHLYDAVGQIWLEMFGEHVHVGELPGWSPVNSECAAPFEQCCLTPH